MRSLLDPDTAACALAVVLGLVAFAIMALALSLTEPRPETGAIAAPGMTVAASAGARVR